MSTQPVLPNARATWTAIRAVIVLFVVLAIVCVIAVYVLQRTQPCHAVTAETLASPDRAFVATKVEVLCNTRHADESGVEIAIAERNNTSGKSRQPANVYAVAGVAAKDVQIAWTGARELRISTPAQHGSVSAQQPSFKDVKITYSVLR